MKIFVDGIAFETTQRRGIRRCTQQVLSRLASRHQISLWTAAPPPGDADIPAGCALFPHYPRAWKPGLIQRVRRQFLKKRAAAALRQHDVFYSTFFTRPIAPGPPEVVTVHDMIAERFADPYDPWLLEQAMQKRAAIRAATLCIAVSQATADELAAFYPETAGRIRVVHHGADHLLTSAAAPAADVVDAGLPSPWALFVGDRGAYKNFRLLLTAAATRSWPADLRLAVVGPPFIATEQMLIDRLGVSDRIVHMGRVDDARLRALYRGAVCLVSPSLDEGFGLPVLEAQALDTPVVCSDIAVYREVLGDSAIYFDPRLAEAVGPALGAVLDAPRAGQLRAAGRRNLSRFSWDKAAELTEAAMLEAARMGRR